MIEDDKQEREGEPRALAPADAQRLLRLAALLGERAPPRTMVDYRQAERDAARLAALLVEELGRERLASAAFVAIPRGGMIVLGMLSYLLDLDPAQLESDPGAAGLVVVVDDCALTGGRLWQALARLAAPEVAVAHLYSTAPLRAAVLARERRVRCCLAARDLAVRSPPLAAEAEASDFERRWRERFGGERYWIGLPELVGFSWSEPDQPFFNPETGRLEDGWRFLTPDRCLKNRVRLLEPLRDEPAGRACAPAGLVTGVFDGRLWLVRTDDQRVGMLEGLALETWVRLVLGYSLEQIVAELGGKEGGSPEELAQDLAVLRQDLLARGFLEPTGAIASP